MANRSQRLNQVALSVTDLRRSHQWYRDVFGLASAGGTELFKGWITARVQGVPGAATSCRWLIDQQEFFQLELFHFDNPPARPLPPDWSPADIGYSMIGIHVRDFDATLAGAARLGALPVAAPLGEAGRRRACLRDPDGVLVEVLEDDPRAAQPRARPRPELPSAVRFVTASVPDLAASRRFFVEGLGLAEARDVTLHTAEHEALWGLPGSTRDTLLLWADDLLLELVQYREPRGRPWPPNYRISDQGLLNIAFGFRSRRALNRALEAAVAAGATPNWRVLELGAWGVVYVNDAQGFSVELLYVRPWWDRRMGFLPVGPDRVVAWRPRIAALTAIVRKQLRLPSADIGSNRAPLRKALITGAAGDLGSELARCLATAGIDLVLTDLDGERLADLATELRRYPGVGVHTFTSDMRDHAALEQRLRELAIEHPDIDLLMANAGVDIGGPIETYDWRTAKLHFDVNTLANYVLLCVFLPRFLERGHGHITATISLGGLIGTPYEHAYNGSKAAMRMLMDGLRAETRGRGVGFTSVFPGYLQGRMIQGNRFNVRSAVPMREAAERIVAATLARRPILKFPRLAALRVTISHLLPPGLRDRIVITEMLPPEQRK